MTTPAGRRAPVVVRRAGSGPEVLLVHGGASPSTTWRGLEPLHDRWALAVVYRRGFPPSPAPSGPHVDFDDDAADLAGLLAARPHLVAHSYGCAGAMLAATATPTRVRSLTLLEPAVHLLPGDPDAERFRQVAETAIAQGPATDPPVLREFLRHAGSPVPAVGPLPESVAAAVRRAHRTRSPYQAKPDLDALRGAPFPIMVASGAHVEVMERTMDALATALGARRVVAPGAGHFVAAAPGFATELEAFLTAAP